MKSYIAALLLLCCIATANADWTTPVPLTGVNTSNYESGPCVSKDGLTLYYARADGSGSFKLYSASRADVSSSFANPTPLLIGGDTGGTYGSYPQISSDGLRLYYSSYTFWMSTRTSLTSPWSSRQSVSGLNVSSASCIRLSGDELVAIFIAPASYGKYDLYTATRTDKNASFSNVRNISELNLPTSSDGLGYLSDDALALYFHSDRSGANLTYKSIRTDRNSLWQTPEVMPFGPGFGQAWVFGDEMFLASGWDFYSSSYVPEPATLALLGLGGFLMRKKNKN